MENMSVDMFKDIVEWLIQSYWVPNATVSLGILGGEPLLHPDFDAMIDFLVWRESTLIGRNLRVHLITNGDSIDNHAQNLARLKSLSFLVNVSSMGSNEEIVRKFGTFCRLSRDATPSFTVADSSIIERLDLFFREFPHIKFFRIGSSSSKNATSFAYYETNKKYLMEAYRHVTKHNKVIVTDCSRIPICAFNEQELKEMRSFRARIDFDANWLGAACLDTAADIMPDGSIVHCVPLYDLTNRELKYHHFESCFQVYSYTFRMISELIERKMSRSAKCMACVEYKTRRCFAGCLGMDIVP
jgi:hypothetical protein